MKEIVKLKSTPQKTSFLDREEALSVIGGSCGSGQTTAQVTVWLNTNEPPDGKGHDLDGSMGCDKWAMQNADGSWDVGYGHIGAMQVGDAYLSPSEFNDKFNVPNGQRGQCGGRSGGEGGFGGGGYDDGGFEGGDGSNGEGMDGDGDFGEDGEDEKNPGREGRRG